MIETGLKGKVVVVTGGTAGIGRATALRFAEEGCRIALWDLNNTGVDALIREIKKAGGEADFAFVDVTSAERVKIAVDHTVAKWGTVDVLINNAGIVRDAQLVKYKDGTHIGVMSDEVFDSVIAVNQRGVFVCTRAIAPLMIANGGGVILNASSVVGLYGNFGQTNYVATKAAVIGMTRTWSRELGKYKIRVNAVTPGFIATEMVRAMPEKVLHSMSHHTPLGRMGEPSDIANAYVWLASDAASFVHGAVIAVDGGLVVGT
jgi:3-oxoacyl-[acyl-carrier protein] reductase